MHFTISNIFTDFGRHKYPSNYFWIKIWTFGHSVGVWHPYKRLVFIHILATVNVLALPRPRLQCRGRIRKARWHKEISRLLEGQGFVFSAAKIWGGLGAPGLGSVQPKPGFSIGNRNQCQILKLVSEPKLFFAAIDFFFSNTVKSRFKKDFGSEQNLS